MFSLLAHILPVLADGVTIQIGGNTFTISSTLIVYLVVAMIIGFIAEFIVGWRLPFGFVGAIIAAIIGIWLMTSVLVISNVGDVYVDNIPLLRALIGAVVLVALWHLFTYRTWRHRRRYSYRRRYYEE
jgi:uncharacterized membrane protein YeaQ/YmgE (transglycosylase-associated protein family)